MSEVPESETETSPLLVKDSGTATESAEQQDAKHSSKTKRDWVSWLCCDCFWMNGQAGPQQEQAINDMGTSMTTEVNVRGSPDSESQHHLKELTATQSEEEQGDITRNRTTSKQRSLLTEQKSVFERLCSCCRRWCRPCQGKGNGRKEGVDKTHSPNGDDLLVGEVEESNAEQPDTKPTPRDPSGDKAGNNQGEVWPCEPAVEAEADSQVGTWERLILGELLQETGTKLRYRFYTPQFHLPKSPVVGWYSSRECLSLQTICAGKILSTKALNISILKPHAGVTFKALQRELPQIGSRQVLVSGTWLPDLTGGNVLMTPEIQDIDILMLLQQSVILSLCDCLIITVKNINRHQLQSLVKILGTAKQKYKTVIIFHYVDDKDDFKSQHLLIEEYLPMPDITHAGHSNEADNRHSHGAKEDCSSEQALQGCSVPSRKMNLFHCLGTDDKAFSGVQQYINSWKLPDSLSGRHCQDTIHEFFRQTIAKFAEVASLTGVVDISELKAIDDGSIELTVTVCQRRNTISSAVAFVQ